MSRYLLAIDQGTTSTRAMLFTPDAKPVVTAQQEFPQHFPRDGWVEHTLQTSGKPLSIAVVR